MLTAEDTRPYFKSTVDTFSQWFNTFLHFKIYDSVKTRSAFEKYFKNSLIIQEENTKKNHKRVVSLYVIKNHVNLHKQIYPAQNIIHMQPRSQGFSVRTRRALGTRLIHMLYFSFSVKQNIAHILYFSFSINPAQNKYYSYLVFLVLNKLRHFIHCVSPYH
jgi:hypothetical protein